MLLEVDGYEAIGEVADRATAMTKVGGCVQVWCCSTYSFPSGDGFDVAVHFTGDPDGRRSC